MSHAGALGQGDVVSTYRTPTPAELARAGAAMAAALGEGDRASREIVARFWWRYSGPTKERGLGSK